MQCGVDQVVLCFIKGELGVGEFDDIAEPLFVAAFGELELFGGIFEDDFAGFEQGFGAVNFALCALDLLDEFYEQGTVF